MAKRLIDITLHIAGFIVLFLLLSCDTQAQVATLYGPVNDASATQVINQIHTANRDEKSTKPIVLFIDSDGGELPAGLKIIDAIQASRRPVWTVDVQMAASMAAVIFTYGEKRAMFPHAMLMFHDAKGQTGGTNGQVSNEIDAWSRVIIPLEKRIAKQAGISYDSFRIKLGDGWWLLAHDAVRAHLADQILVMDQYPLPDGQALQAIMASRQ